MPHLGKGKRSKNKDMQISSAIFPLITVISLSSKREINKEEITLRNSTQAKAINNIEETWKIVLR